MSELSILRFASFVADGFDFRALTRDMVRLGFLVKLPFRLRLGELYRHTFQLKEKSFEVILHNEFLVPEDLPTFQLIFKAKPIDVLWTEALIVVKNPKIRDDTLGKLREWSPEKGGAPRIESGRHVFEAMRALNHFIIAYSTGAKQLFGGHPLRLFRMNDLFDYLKWEISIFSSPNGEMTDDECKKAFDIRPDREIVATGQITGDLHDLLLEEVRANIEKHLHMQDLFIHYELAFEAKSKMVAGDHIGALLLAVAALEGAHAAFVQHQLRLSVPGDTNDLTERFIRELGMSLCNQITPYLLMSEDERPDSATIDKATQALKIRNEIMHLLKNKRGKYRIRTRTNKEISDAYSAVLRTYNCYVAALEAHATDAKRSQSLDSGP